MTTAPVDEIRLTLPRDREFHGVARLVLSGLASRQSATFEGLDDLRIALETLLERRDAGEEVTVTLRVGEHELETCVGPFRGGIADELGGDAAGVGLRRILEAVSDRFDFTERAGGQWVCLTKTLSSGGAD